MDMGSPAGVVPREQSLKLDQARGISLLNATEEGFVHIGAVVRVAVAAGDDTRVHTPQIQVS
jgi:hypothetical protein